MPIMYCEPADIKHRFGFGDVSVITAINDAGAFIRGFMSGSPAIPLLRPDGSVPDAVKHRAIRIATYYLQLAADCADDSTRRNHRADIAWLDQVARGEIQIDMGESP